MMDLNKIYCGDCIELIKNIPDKSIDVSFTSPPYNRIRNDTYEYYNDTLDDYLGMLINITDEMIRVTKGYVIVNIQCNHFNKKEFYQYLGHYYDRINGVIIWGKTNPQPANNYNSEANTRSVTNAFEYFIILKDGGKFVTYGKEQFTNVITTSINSKHFKGHGAVMKQEVCELFIKKFTKPNDIVLDPFMGCGTTGVCCKLYGRNYIGFELQPQYVEICNNRIDDTIVNVSIDDLLDLL